MHAQAHRFVRICVGRRGGGTHRGMQPYGGPYVRGFSLASPKRRDPRRAGFVLRCADKRHRPNEARDVTGTSTGAPLLFPINPCASQVTKGGAGSGDGHNTIITTI